MQKDSKKRIVQLLDENRLCKCTVCGTYKVQAVYRFKHEQIVSRWKPPVLEPVCRKCVYRECFGSKKFKKEMKERSLDGKL